MREWEGKAPAKVNLCLDVLRRRPDGYHSLRTILQTVSLYDRVRIRRRREGVVVRCNWPSLATPANLAYRAAVALKERYGVEEGVEMELEKAIPWGAGLGGGSSDAATTLLALNSLWGLHRPWEELLPLALSLGADVPFFLRGGCALAEGIGEQLTPLRPRAKYALLLVKPPLAIETRWAYQVVDEASELFHPEVEAVRRALEAGDVEALAAALGNTLEGPVFRAHPLLQRWKETLLAVGALGAAMSGSGSALFGLFRSLEEAREAEERFRQKGVGEVWSCVVEPVFPTPTLLAAE